MNKFKIIRRQKDNKIIWTKSRFYIDVFISICCLIIAFNIHPNKYSDTSDTETNKMTYIFHDYEWNKYILNDTIHWAADSMDYLFNKEVPENIQWNYTDSVSLWWNKSENSWTNNQDEENIKDNQVSIENIMNDLWVNWELKENNEDYLIISLWSNEGKTENSENNENSTYSIKEDSENTTLIIEKDQNKTENEYAEENDENNNKEFLTAKTFTYISEWRIIPSLLPWDDLSLNSINSQFLAYNNWERISWISIIDDYNDCMTPRWYKIVHGDSVLAYKQLDNAPDICNIERRYCRNGKLSWTYTQQWCSINKNYSYNLRWQAEVPQKDDEIKWWARQNPDWTVSVKSDEIWWWFVFDRPNRPTTEYSYSDNFRNEWEWIEQTDRPHRDCTAPRWEKIKHGQIIQAFKHANWFSDAPCETQFRLCSMWELMWTFSESTCKTRDTSFIDWINGSPTRETYSKEKLNLIKKQIKNEEKYYKNTRKNEGKATNSNALDKILYILDN